MLIPSFAPSTATLGASVAAQVRVCQRLGATMIPWDPSVSVDAKSVRNWLHTCFGISLPRDRIWLDLGDSVAAMGEDLEAIASQWIVLLDAGVTTLVVGGSGPVPEQLEAMLRERGVPSERILVRTSSFLSSYFTRLVPYSQWQAASVEPGKPPTVVEWDLLDVAPSAQMVSQLDSKSMDLIVSQQHLQFPETTPTTTTDGLDILEAWLCVLKTDRQDGLYATVVVDERDTALGLVYSSRESLRAAIQTGTGVYYSRSRKGLWAKGETSGAKQLLHRIEVDCDRDALKVVVTQADPGFCHKNTRTCFGATTGIAALQETLQSRLQNPIPQSYTNKLFTDSQLLHAKIMEEAGELCSASDKDEIAWEAADVLYFALAKCVKAGVSLEDVERHLDARSMKITRRPGLAKVASAALPPTPPNKASATLPPTPRNKSTPPSVMADEQVTLRVYQSSEISETTRQELLRRPIMDAGTIAARVEPIMKDVRARGDQALLDLTAKFDGVRLVSPVLRAPFPESILQQVPAHVRDAIDVAFDNIHTFHKAQLQNDVLTVETMPGVVCSRFSRPIERVGLYVPGGSAVLPSTAMMLGIPAMVAQCQRIILATPPCRDGSVCPEVVYVAQKVGAEMVLLAGGAQAVAAMAYGTQSVPKVDKICGPGNQYVTAAKMIAQNDPSCLISIDMPAGPSEVLVIADSTSNPVFVASDLLSQAEHGPDSQVVLLTVGLTPAELDTIQTQVRVQTQQLPRATIVRQSLAKSFVLECKDEQDAMAFSNAYAPEHLILHTRDPRALMEQVQSAGSVFLGPYSPESCGDYASGTNHTLPTYGYARMYSGVNTNTFLKHITAQELTQDGLNRLGDTVATLAEVEELHGHRNAVLLRLKEIRGQ